MGETEKTADDRTSPPKKENSSKAWDWVGTVFGSSVMLVGLYFGITLFASMTVRVNHDQGQVTIVRSSWWGLSSSKRTLSYDAETKVWMDLSDDKGPTEVRERGSDIIKF